MRQTTTPLRLAEGERSAPMPKIESQDHRLEAQSSIAQHHRVERRSRIIRAIWAACFLLAALNHARILLQHGLSWDYGGVGRASAAYWTSLTIIDPLVAALLFVRPRIGIPAAVVLIVTNVIHNLAVTARLMPDGEFLTRATSSPQIVSQMAFLLFVLATARMAWRGAWADGRPPRPPKA